VPGGELCDIDRELRDAILYRLEEAYPGVIGAAYQFDHYTLERALDRIYNPWQEIEDPRFLL
jgi:hypothetical protein